MNVVAEGDLRITLPHDARPRKFDDERHRLSHYMKAVDFVVETNDRVLFIEVKDPDHPRAAKEARAGFVKQLLDGELDHDLVYKFRDSFLYEWARGGCDKPIHYWVIVALDSLSNADLIYRTDALKRKLPVTSLPPDWRRRIAHDCAVFNIRTWNERLSADHGYRLQRDSA